MTQELEPGLPLATASVASQELRADHRRALRDGVLAGATLLVVTVVGLLGVLSTSEHWITEECREDLMRLAAVAACQVDPELHRGLRRPEQLDSPDYERAVRGLRRMRAAALGVKYIYTAVRDGDRVRFVLDAAVPGDHDGDGQEDRAGVFEPYEDHEPELLVALGDGRHRGTPTASPAPYHDKWGWFMTGYTPLVDEHGQQFGVLGIDVDAATFLDRLEAARHHARLGAVPALGLSLLLSVLTYVVRRRGLRTTRELQASEQRFRRMFELSPVGMAINDLDTGSFLDCNQALLQATGYDKQTFLQLSYWDITPRDYEPQEQVQLASLKAHGRYGPYEKEYLHRDGHRVPVLLQGVRARGANGRELIWSVVQDITARKQTEVTLHRRGEALAAAAQANQQLAAAIEATGDAVFLTDARGAITFANAAFTSMSGWSLEQIRGRTPAVLKSGRTDPEVYRELWGTVCAGRTWTGRLCNQRHQEAGGGLYWIDATITPMLDADGGIRGFVAVSRDATELVDAQEGAALAREGAEAKLRIASLLADSGPLRERLDRVLATVLELRHVGANRGGVILGVGPGGTHTDVLAQRGMPEPWLRQGPSRLIDGCDWQAAALAGEVVVAGDSHAGGNGSADACLWPPPTAHGHYLVPLLHAGVCQGLLYVTTEPQPPNDQARLDALRHIGELVALALVRESADRFLIEARERAEAASRAKSEFLANMSHEIRSPMTAILGYAELLADDQDAPGSAAQRQEYLDTIRRNGEHLLAIINDVLDIAKIEAGKMSLELIATNPAQLVDDVCAVMRVRAAGKGIQLQVEHLTDIPQRIRTDPTRLHQILMNLVGNAVKFTEQGGVTIRLRYVPSDAGDGSSLQIGVQDTGLGMTREQLARLFEAFEQGDASTSRRFGGTGLGLRISKRLAELLGGQIHVHSDPGHGSCFTVELPVGPVAGIAMARPVPLPPRSAPVAAATAQVPVDAGAEAKPGTPEAPRTGVSLRGLRVLFAEDGADNQRLVSFLLRKAGAEVTVVQNGRELVEALTQGNRLETELALPAPVDLVLTDMQMPEMDGYTATRLLRAKGCELPIVAITAHAMIGDEEQCLAAGCDLYTTKPIDRTRLLQACLEAKQLRSPQDPPTT